MTTGAAWKFTANHDGYYFCNAFVSSASRAWAADDVMQIKIFKNGGVYSTIERHETEGAITQILTVGGSDLVDLNSGEYIDFRVYHDTGGDINLYGSALFNHCAIFRI